MGKHQVEEQTCAVCDLMERLPPEIQEKIFQSLPEDVRQVCLEGRLSFTEDRTVSLPGLAGRTVRLFVAAHGGWVRVQYCRRWKRCTLIPRFCRKVNRV